MLKCSKGGEGSLELEEALATMLDIIKSVNDSMHQIAITGFEVSAQQGDDLSSQMVQGEYLTGQYLCTGKSYTSTHIHYSISPSGEIAVSQQCPI